MLRFMPNKILGRISLQHSAHVSSSSLEGNDNIQPVMYNRNPRNLERLTIGYKPSGYALETPGREYWHKQTDVSAYHNLGKIMAQRCLESGINEVFCNMKSTNPDGKLAAFLSAVTSAGISLTEPQRYIHPQATDKLRPEKPWEVHE